MSEFVYLMVESQSYMLHQAANILDDQLEQEGRLDAAVTLALQLGDKPTLRLSCD